MEQRDVAVADAATVASAPCFRAFGIPVGSLGGAEALEQKRLSLQRSGAVVREFRGLRKL